MGAAGNGAEAIAAHLRSFLAAQSQVRLIEGQEVLLALDGRQGGFSVACENGRVVLHVWAPGHSLVRRVVGARAAKNGLQLQALRFGQQTPAPLWIEAGAQTRASGGGREFRARALAAIEREWGGWRPIPPVGRNRGPGPQGGGNETEGPPPLEFFLFQRQRSFALAVAVPPGRTPAVADGALTALVLWAHALEFQQGLAEPARLMIVMPARQSATTLGRLPWLRGAERFAVCELDESAGHLRFLSPLADANWDSVVRRAPAERAAPLSPAADALWAQIRQLCPRATVAHTPAGLAFRLHGLTFARQARGPAAALAEFTFGLGAAGEIPGWAGDFTSRPLTPERMDDFRAMLLRLDRERSAGAPPGFLRHCQPEAWLEEAIRADITALDAVCDPRFVYPQVPAFRRGQREVLDLLAADRDGVLRVLEIKASEDAQFPFQALDYWRAVRRHQQRGDFSRLGYFPGLVLSDAPPQLTLAAPALRWHPGTAALLRWLSPEIRVNRVGLDEHWRQQLRAVERY